MENKLLVLKQWLLRLYNIAIRGAASNLMQYTNTTGVDGMIDKMSK